MSLDSPDVSENRQFPIELLERSRITEIGQTLPGIDGQLVRIPQLEGQIFSCSKDLVVPNPNQPRMYFDPAKMGQLKATILDLGQQDAIRVTAFEKDGELRLCIIDGERRFRVISELGDRDPLVLVTWKQSEMDLFIASLIANESRAEHNPIERARAYEKLINHYMTEEGMNKGEAVKLVSNRLGISTPTITNHLRLLKMDPTIQQAVIEGVLPTTQALNLHAVQKRLGGNVDAVKHARALLDNLDTEADLEAIALQEDQGKVGKGRGLKKDDLKKEKRRQRMLGADSKEQRALDAADSIFKLTTGLSSAKKGSEKVLRADEDLVVRYLRSRQGNPPEVVVDGVRTAIARLTDVLGIVERAAAPDPLPEIPGKPSFGSFVRRNSRAFGTPLRTRLASVLAEASDSAESKVFSSNEIAAKLQVVPSSIGPNVRELMADLKPLGLTVEQHVKREKLVDAWVKNSAYRLAWADTTPVEARSTDAFPEELEKGKVIKVYYDQTGRILTATDRNTLRRGTGFGLQVDFVPTEQPEVAIVSRNGTFNSSAKFEGGTYSFSDWLNSVNDSGVKIDFEAEEED